MTLSNTTCRASRGDVVSRTIYLCVIVAAAAQDICHEHRVKLMTGFQRCGSDSPMVVKPSV